jgi:hypothetical protein
LRASLLLLPLLPAVPAHAQIDDDSQVWTAATASTKLDDRLELGLESIARFGNDAGGLYEIEFGGSLSYEIAKGVKVQVGYIRVPDYDRAGVTSIEDRPRQQISYVFGKIGGGTLSGRMRLEERWRNDGSDMGLRLRPQLRFALPFHAGSKTALVLSHESFVALNDTDWGQRRRYERMRNLIAITTPLTKGVALEAGYLNQYGFGRNGRPDSMDHVASLSISITI